MSTSCRKICRWGAGALFLIFAGLLACGPYSFSGNSLPPHIKTIAVPLFEDQTSEFGIKEKLTDAVINEITRDNTLKITSEDAADAIVYGKIISVDDRADTYTEQEEVQAYRVYITVEVEVRDVKMGKPLWKERWSQWGLYSLADGLEARQQGIDEAIQKLAEDILNKTISNW
ncbi:MAG TPA: hypothetical protein ENJ23_03505 [Bacteroidetes bacterium]|nr:hypothetical protein [Bacteroidota bacterium]